MKQLKQSSTACGNVNGYNHCGQLSVSTTADHMDADSATLHIPAYSTEMCTEVHQETYKMSMTVLFVKAKNWKQPQYSPTME